MFSKGNDAKITFLRKVYLFHEDKQRKEKLKLSHVQFNMSDYPQVLVHKSEKTLYHIIVKIGKGIKILWINS